MNNVAQSAFPLALVHQAQGRLKEAREVLSVVSGLAFERRNSLFMQMAEAFKAELDLQQGRIAEATNWAQQFKLGAFRSMQRFYLPELTLAKALLAQDTADSHAQAADLLAQLQEHAESIHNNRVLIEVLALTALLLDAQDDEPAALDNLEQAIHLAEPGGWIRLFVDLGPRMAGLLDRLSQRGAAPDYIAQILAAFPSETRDGSPRFVHRPSSALIEPLTDRELEVLALLAQRLTNKKIAARLVISPATVRTHTYNIYQKLNVRGRRQAVSKAIELGILPSNSQ